MTEKWLGMFKGEKVFARCEDGEILDGFIDYFKSLQFDGKIKPINPPEALTKREQFAAMSMQGILSGGNLKHDYWPDDEKGRRLLSEISVGIADELLEELEKTEPKEDLKPCPKCKKPA